jgi:hypothetical protein
MCGISSSSPKANKPGAAVASVMTEAAARPRALLANARNDASLPDAASSTSMAGELSAVCVCVEVLWWDRQGLGGRAERCVFVMMYV